MRISDWSSDVCSSDLIGINPLVPFNAGLGDARGGAPVDDANDGQRLVNGGLPAVLSQTFRTLLQSRMHVGLARYAQQYPGIDQMVFEPNAHDGELFHTNAFSLPARRRVCQLDRKSVGEGKSVSVRVYIGGTRNIKKKNNAK